MAKDVSGFTRNIFGEGHVGVRKGLANDLDPAEQLRNAADIIMNNIHWAMTEDGKSDDFTGEGLSVWLFVYERLNGMASSYKRSLESS